MNTLIVHPKDKSNKTIFGDAAAATLISIDDGICSIGDFVFGSVVFFTGDFFLDILY